MFTVLLLSVKISDKPCPVIQGAGSGLQMNALRVEILQALRDSRLQRQQLETVEYVI